MNRMAGLYESIDAVPLDEWERSVSHDADLLPGARIPACPGTDTAGPGPHLSRTYSRARRQAGRLREPVSVPGRSAFVGEPSDSRRAAWVRKLFPGLTQVKILMCGLPFSAGQSHLAFAPGADRPRILEQLDLLLRQLARREGATDHRVQGVR